MTYLLRNKLRLLTAKLIIYNYFQVAVMAVWITSALYSAPKFFWVKTVTNEIDGFTETICIADRAKHNSEILDMISFALLYVMPLSVMTVSIIDFLP